MGEPSNMTKEQSHVILVPHNIRMVQSNVKKIRKPQNMTKVQSHVMLVLYNVMIVSSSVKKW